MTGDPSEDFPAALTAALRSRGLTLAQVADELAARGLVISLATLSYWSTGRSLPGRRSSQRVVTELEDILAVPAGTLVSALADGVHDLWQPTAVMPGTVDAAALRAAGLDLDRHATTLVAQDALRVDDGVTTTTTVVLRSEEAGLARFALLAPLPLADGAVPHVVASDGCTIGAPVQASSGDDGLPGAWLLPVRPDHPLEPGEAWQVGYVLRWDVDGPVRGLARPVPATLRWLVQEAWLGPDNALAATHEVRATDADGRSVGAPSVVPVRGPDGHVQHATGQAAGGLHLLRWQGPSRG